MVLDNSFSYVLGYIAAWSLLISIAAFTLKILKKNKTTGWLYILVVNLAFTLIGILALALVMEGYYGFFYDEPDSYGLLLTSQRWFKRHYHLNNAGFRDDKDYFSAKGAGKRRIVFIGDSFTAGHGVKNIGDRFTGIIETRLKKERGNNYEVYTLAKNGWDTYEELNYLAKLDETGFQADTVIFCYTMNDIGWASDESRSILKSLYDMKPDNWLLRHSFFLNFLYMRMSIFPRQEVKDYYEWLSGFYTDRTWDIEWLMLRKLKEGCKKNGWELKVVIFPLIDDLSDGFKMKGGHDKVSEFLKKEGIPYIDLADRLKEYPAKKLTVNRFDSHPNEFANKIIAGEIWNKLL